MKDKKISHFHSCRKTFKKFNIRSSVRKIHLIMHKRNLQTDFNIMCKKSIILLKYFQYRNIENNSFKTSKKTRTFYFPTFISGSTRISSQNKIRKISIDTCKLYKRLICICLSVLLL